MANFIGWLLFSLVIAALASLPGALVGLGLAATLCLLGLVAWTSFLPCAVISGACFVAWAVRRYISRGNGPAYVSQGRQREARSFHFLDSEPRFRDQDFLGPYDAVAPGDNRLNMWHD